MQVLGISIFTHPDHPVCDGGIQMSAQKFGTVINCIDGRVQTPVNDFLKAAFGLDYVDTITEPGPNRVFSNNQDAATIEAALEKVNISATKHGSKVLGIVGHFDCAANPVDEREHIAQIQNAVKTLKSHIGDEMNILGLWVDEHWQAHRVSEA